MRRSVLKERLRQGAALFLILALMSGVTAMSGCGRAKYTVDYCGQKSGYRGAKDTYRAGQTVRLYYDEVGTDTDYTFLLDGENLNCTYRPSRGFLIRFVMPAHDVTLQCDAQCSMVRSGEDQTEPDETASETERGTTAAEPQTGRDTTVPPTAVTTTATTTTTTLPNGRYDFTAQYIRTNGVQEDEKFPQAFCVTDCAGLDAHLSKYKALYHTSDTAQEKATQSYDDAWFMSHTLLLVVLEESSGSVRHTVTRVEKTAPHAGTVVIRRDVPEVGTCDMADWYIWIELPAGTFTAADAIEVVMQ